MECLKKTIPNLNIYTSKNAGQNYQLLFPLLYKYLCITLPDYLYTVVERQESHSRQFTNVEDIISQQKVYEATSIATVQRFNNISDRDKCNLLVEISEHYEVVVFFLKWCKTVRGTSSVRFIIKHYRRLSFKQWLIFLKYLLIRLMR